MSKRPCRAKGCDRPAKRGVLAGMDYYLCGKHLAELQQDADTSTDLADYSAYTDELRAIEAQVKAAREAMLEAGRGHATRVERQAAQRAAAAMFETILGPLLIEAEKVGRLRKLSARRARKRVRKALKGAE